MIIKNMVSSQLTSHHLTFPYRFNHLLIVPEIINQTIYIWDLNDVYYPNQKE